MLTRATRIAIADDHPVVTNALKNYLQSLPSLSIVHLSSNGNRLIDALAQDPCDLIITDFTMGYADASVDGFGLLTQLARRFPSAKVIIFSSQTNPAIILRALKLGVRAFVSKNDHQDELARACIHATGGGGKIFLSPFIQALLDSSLASPTAQPRLTQKELEGVRLYASGNTLADIATRQGRSVSTISSQKTLAMRKLGVSTNTDLIRYAKESGLME